MGVELATCEVCSAEGDYYMGDWHFPCDKECPSTEPGQILWGNCNCYHIVCPECCWECNEVSDA